ncbi:MAG: cellulase family glycosylhydrolase [Solirubrobacterales bacterium]
MRMRLAPLVGLACLATSTAALAAPTAPLGHDGRWITDARGRAVILHGVNMVYKRPPYAPAAAGFGRDDARLLARHGFNNVRLGVIYAGVEQQPGTYSAGYLRGIKQTQQLLARRGIFSLLDFHQDLYNERFSGEGFPDWAVIDDGQPADPLTGFPGTYLSSPGLNRSFDNLWANRPASDGVGLEDHYAAAWGAVADRFRNQPYVLGYDLFNEPWPGSDWPTCTNPSGCPAFEAQKLAPLQGKAIAAIRAVDRKHLVWYEPVVFTQFGIEYNHPDTGDRRAGMSFHIYCVAGGVGQPCPQLEEQSMQNANERADANGDTLLLSEFGATGDPDVIARMTALADRYMTSWQWWHYCACDDPTTSGPGDVQAIVSDPSRPPKGDNVLRDKLALIERPYPQAVAGTPLRYGFDPDSREFTLAYSTTAPNGKRLAPDLETAVFTAPIQYPDGYRAKVTGGRVVSKRNARVLRIERGRGAARVELTIAPAGA